MTQDAAFISHEEFLSFANQVEDFDAEDIAVDEESFESPLDDVDVFITAAQAFVNLTNLSPQFWQIFRNNLNQTPELVSNIYIFIYP